MPRTADHDQRRRQIASAVRALIAEAGLDAATMASVAREAGFSVGLVQHYFPSKDDLLLFTYRQVMADVGARLAVRIDRGETRERPISAILFDGMLELLPLDDDRRAEYRVARVFRGRSLDNPALAAVARATAADLRTQFATAVRNGKECGEVEPDADADLAATRFSALLDGLADQLYEDPGRRVGRRRLPVAGKKILHACVGDTFTGECRQYRSTAP
ncbi:TetR family transcriptional regulator [Amycolatopsis antarctica]|uniref:TetR family transcriptional regulator n=1 Tax=Amycolatopsis antarctica TaxID=1854586 RepID=A0A263D2P1_9PSEU|nr:TetR/AcrR family transcriptional regulator [Amycolatopsis antarctica]OZM71625.1 TetR family transcriptional regulator [Amycolatopsis antarctica]